MNNKWILGIDTSNYTTSLALTNSSRTILADLRKQLMVKQGERGLRQSHALFQHMESLPDMILDLFGRFDKNQICAVAVSSRPRSIEGSYMPVFKAGENYGKILAAGLGVPFFDFSHQEGHIEAAAYNTSLSSVKEFLAYHLSGGTCELLHCDNQSCRIIGGTKDISFGQVIDRIGVALNLSFPAGKEMDRLALQTWEKIDYSEKKREYLKKIPMDGLFINLSGIETQCQRALAATDSIEDLILELFLRISDCLCLLTEKAVKETGCPKVLFSGGVSASQFIRNVLNDRFNGSAVKLEFGDPALSSDNAVGISLLGGKELWP